MQRGGRVKDWNLGLREGPGFVEFDMDDLEKACQCNVDAYADYPLYPAIFGSLAGPDMIYKNDLQKLVCLHPGDGRKSADGDRQQ